MSLHARHRQQQPFRPSVKGDLQRLGQVLDRHDVAAQAHASQDHDLLLERLARTPEHSATNAANVIAVVGPGVV